MGSKATSMLRCPQHSTLVTCGSLRAWQSHCITWFQTQLVLTTCQIHYHSHLWDHRSTGQL